MRILSICVAAACFWNALVTPTASAATAEAKVTIDLGNREEAARQIETLGAALSGPVVRLDVTVRARGSGAKADYGVVRERAGKAVPVRCATGPGRFPAERSSFRFEFGADYTHLLLTVEHGDATSAPFSTVACEYDPGSTQEVFFIRGYFAVSTISVPEATDVLLRPVSPAIER